VIEYGIVPMRDKLFHQGLRTPGPLCYGHILELKKGLNISTLGGRLDDEERVRYNKFRMKEAKDKFDEKIRNWRNDVVKQVAEEIRAYAIRGRMVMGVHRDGNSRRHKTVGMV
jgi:hypothetical protein